MCEQDWFISQLELKLCQNSRECFFNQRLRQRFLSSILLLDCPFLCLVPRDRNLICGTVCIHFCLNGFDKLTGLSRNNLLNFCYRRANHQNSICRKLFNDSVPGKCYGIAKAMDRLSQKLGVVWRFLESKPAFLKKPAAAFLSSRYQPTFSFFNKQTGMLIVAFGFKQRKIDRRKVPMIVNPNEMSWISNSGFSKQRAEFLSFRR